MTVTSQIRPKAAGAKCSECPLAKQRCAPTSGPADAKIAVVSRSPGTRDVSARKPFAGKSGEVLNHLLGLYGVKREEVLLTNVVLCYHDGTPPKEAIRACRERLAIDIANTSTIIAAGSEAVTELTRAKSLEGTRGFVHNRRSNGRDQRVIATNNPALVLRDDSAFPNLVRDFKLALAPLPPPTLPHVDWTNNVGEAKRWLTTISKQNITTLGVDIETLGLRASAPIVAIGLTTDGSRAISFGEQPCKDENVFNALGQLVGSKFIEHLYHNGKFDVRNFRNKGIPAKVDQDTMLLSWVLDERSDENQVHKLEYLLMNELNWPNYEPQIVRNWKADVRRLEKDHRYDELAALPIPDELYEYNALDVAGTAQLFPILKERAISDGVWERPYKSLLLHASDALVEVELTGTNYDVEAALDLLEDEVWPKLNQQRAELQLIVGDGNYNPASSVQTSKLVYDDWHIQHNLPLKNDRSVEKSVYTEIKAGRFICNTFDGREAVRRGGQIDEIRNTAIRWATLFADFKELNTQRGTFLEGLIKLASVNDGKLFTDFKLHNTVTGRLSSSRPNLQNITRTKPGLPNIRSLFRASPGRVILQADYSQAELRCLAKLSGDAELSRVYQEKLDLHNIAAERFYGPDFTKEQRSRAKNMNFGVPYGQSAGTFQEKHDIPEAEGEKFIEWWFDNFAGVKAWKSEVAKDVKRGEVVSPFGHKRRFYLLTRENINAAIREGINFLPQNIAANFTLYSLIQLVRHLDRRVASVILTVHDSILLDVAISHVHDVADIVRNTMIAAPYETLGWDFPFDADVQVGPNWGTLYDLADYDYAEAA